MEYAVSRPPKLTILQRFTARCPDTYIHMTPPDVFRPHNSENLTLQAYTRLPETGERNRKGSLSIIKQFV